ncbi:MAG TPA: hypothetical protein VJH23_00485 [archaeon]|nr:hypothetical protein [archaeon]
MLGIRKDVKTKIVGNIITKGFMGFFILFISLMSFAVFFGGFGNIFEGKIPEFLNWHLFWSFLINSFVKPEFEPLDKKEGI